MAPRDNRQRLTLPDSARPVAGHVPGRGLPVLFSQGRRPQWQSASPTIPHVVITDGDPYRMRQARAKGGTTTNKN
jgi:hypothetical protein